MLVQKIWCQCGTALALPDNWTVAQCGVCHATHYPVTLKIRTDRAAAAPAGTTDSMPAGEAALVEVNKLAQRMTVLEGRVDELCRALRSAKSADAPAETKPTPINKGYWR